MNFHNKPSIITLLLAGVVSSGGAYAEEPSKPQTPGEPAQALTDSIDAAFTELDDLVVVTQKKVMKSDGAKLTYDLDEDASSKGQNVLEALKKIPMVSVDGSDQIRVKGSTAFKIYVNGKEEPMLTANADKILKAMPAEAVSKIEVITEPGAKYDAEGTGGIINLITERTQRNDGYTASVSANLGAQNEGVSAYGRMKYNKVTADANFNYNDNVWMSRRQFTSNDNYDYTSDSQYLNSTHVAQKFNYHYYGGGINLSWEPSATDLFTATGNIYAMDANLKDINISSQTFSRGGSLTQAYTQNLHGDMSHLGASGNIGYTRSFGSNGHNLMLGYAFNYGKQFLDFNYFTVPELNADFLPPFRKSENANYTREHTAAIDYTNPFGGGKHILEAGVKGIFRRNSAIAGDRYGMSPSELFADGISNTDTRQIQDVYAAYASYSSTFGKLAVKAGLRYEHTYMGMDFLTGEMENYRRNLNDVVPNAALTWMFGPATNLRLAYQMRIQRPSISQMNPYEMRIIETDVRMGNPDLESERHNKLSLAYSNYGRKIGWSISLEGSQSNNTIEEVTYYEQNVRYQTYANLGHKQRMELSGFMNWNLTNQFSVGFNGSLHYTRIASPGDEITNHGWNASYGANFNYVGPWHLKFSGYGGQSTGEISLQGRWYGWYYYGLGISRSFLKNDALTLTLNANNFLSKYTHFHGEVATPGHYTSFRNRSANWNVGITIGWTFGHLNDQVKKTAGSITNDDQKASGNQGGGSGIGL